jgi:hypothetical protein
VTSLVLRRWMGRFGIFRGGAGVSRIRRAALKCLSYRPHLRKRSAPSARVQIPSGTLYSIGGSRRRAVTAAPLSLVWHLEQPIFELGARLPSSRGRRPRLLRRSAGARRRYDEAASSRSPRAPRPYSPRRAPRSSKRRRAVPTSDVPCPQGPSAISPSSRGRCPRIDRPCSFVREDRMLTPNTPGQRPGSSPIAPLSPHPGQSAVAP